MSPPLESRTRFTRQILDQIGSGQPVSQRSLSRELGIALGLTNVLLRQLVTRGWIRLVQVKPSRVRYLLTPAGIAEKARMSRVYLEDSIKLYAHARERIGHEWRTLSTTWEPAGGTSGRKCIAFAGTSEVAEIGYVCLQETDLQLVGAIDNTDRERFFTVPVYRWQDLQNHIFDWASFDRLVVMSFDDRRPIQEKLGEARFPLDRVIWL